MEWLASCPRIFMGLALVHFQKYWLLKENLNLPTMKLHITHANTTIQPHPPSVGLGDSSAKLSEKDSSISVLSWCSDKILNFMNSWKSTFPSPSKSLFSIHLFFCIVLLYSSSVLFQSNASFTKERSFIVIAPMPPSS